ncbi:MAG TPA: hypothetical protein VL728_13630 [Cyclobacteriaceae bacterium]|jgi:hypothetical protein|nr:hypothetical protein [Cyclobacteriaceae bacterium]
MSSGKIAYSHVKFSLSVIVICNFLATVGSAQADSTFSVMRNGVEAKFPYTKWMKPEQFNMLKSSSLPLYSFNQVQYNRIKSLLTSFGQMENDYRLLLNNYREKEMVFSTKEKTLVDKAALEEERAKNFEASYNKVLAVNAQLNEQIKKTEQLAIREHKKRNMKTILIGALALSAGVVCGVTIR